MTAPLPSSPDLPVWAYIVLAPIVVLLLFLYGAIKKDARPKYDKPKKKRK